MTELKVGDTAPDFSLLDERGLPLSLRDYLGRHVVILYFYPKDFTPGCTKEACSFKDDFSEFEKRDVVILGVSYDEPEEHVKFRIRYSLPYILLSDKDKRVSKIYGAEGVFTAKRITYIIDKEGKIAALYPKVDVNIHSKEILDSIDRLQ